MLMFAYGMNTNAAGMADRCPGAVSLGPAQLEHHRFRFAGHADVVKDLGHNVEGVLWEITEEHLARLDNFEGYPNYYDRKVIEVVLAENEEVVSAIVYFMQPGFDDRKPGDQYLTTVYLGYKEHGVPCAQLLEALTHNVKTHYA